MQNQNFTTTLSTDQTPAEVFNALLDPRAWWSEEIEGSTDKLNDVFHYRYEDVHSCTVKLIEVVPEKKTGLENTRQLFQLHKGQNRVDRYKGQL